MKINKFRLVIGGQIFLSLTKKNYRNIIQGDTLTSIIAGMIAQMEKENVRGMAIRQHGFDVQIDKVQPAKEIKA